MNKPSQPTKPASTAEKSVASKPTKPITSDRQRGIVAFELLFAAATLGAAILYAAMSEPKLPPGQGD